MLHNGFHRICVTNATGPCLPLLGYIRRIKGDCLGASVVQRIVSTTRPQVSVRPGWATLHHGDGAHLRGPLRPWTRPGGVCHGRARRPLAGVVRTFGPNLALRPSVEAMRLPRTAPKVALELGFYWWSRLVSNQRPSACEADALPLSYETGFRRVERGRRLTRNAVHPRIRSAPIPAFTPPTRYFTGILAAMNRWPPAPALATAAALALAPTAAAQPVGFTSADGNVGGLTDGCQRGATSASGRGRSHHIRLPGDYGQGIVVNAGIDRVPIFRLLQRQRADSGPALPYGQAMQVNSIRCQTSPIGVACRGFTNGRGFSMFRDGYTLSSKGYR